MTAAFPPPPQGLGRGMRRGQSEGGAGKKNLVSHFLLQCKGFLAPVLWRALGTFHLSLATLWLLSELPHANFGPYYKSSQAVWHTSPILKMRGLGL